MLTLDHIAVSARSLAEGTEWVEAALGTSLAPGGRHPHMATHNRLLGLGELYLEVIAIDPDAPPPRWPRWFDLDHFAGPPRLTNWVARSDDLAADLALAPPGTGSPVTLERGPYRWDMAVPETGRLPFDGAYPALIHWHPPHHPAQALPDRNIRLTRLEIAHPQAAALRLTLALSDPRLHISQGPATEIRATFTTPQGSRALARILE